MPAPRKYNYPRAPAARPPMRRKAAPRRPAAPARAYAPRKPRVMTGSGRYYYDKTKDPYTMANIGAQMGGNVGAYASKWFGSGDYTVQENTLIKPSSVPIMHSADSSVRIRHKEFIQDITATNAFSLESFSINPGLSASFPYLSGLAQNFESYRIHGMVWTFKSTSADALNSTNTALGSLFLATDYNALDASFTTKAGMLATTFSNSGKPACDILHPIECAPNSSSSLQRYIRTGAVSSGDLRLYDWGNFQIGSQGQQASSVVGELWCSYDVELINPQLTVPRGLTIPCEMVAVTPDGVTNLVPFGTSGTGITATLGASFTNNTIILPANTYGKFVLNLVWIGGSQTTTVSSIVGTNVTELSLFTNKTAALQTSISGGAETELFIRYCFEITDPLLAGVITFNGLVLPTPVTSLDINIMKLNGNAA